MNREAFRKKVWNYRSQAGIPQNELAKALGLHPKVLSQKLNGSSGNYLTHPQIKQIVRSLADWEAITTRAEACELLELMDLKSSCFSESEWQTPPLNKLSSVAVLPGFSTSNNSPVKNQNPGLIGSQHNLPARLTPFIGREWALKRVQTLLHQPETRLITLTGPGGTGKTRLALELAYNSRSHFKAGVYFVNLASIANPELVPFEILRTLGATELNSFSILDSLKHFLSHKELLLVLDNFEHLLAAANIVGDILEAARGLKILVTSREVLNLYGEIQFGIPPLDLPPKIDQPFFEFQSTIFREVKETENFNPDQFLNYEAIRFFLARVRAVRPDFELTPKNLKAVTEICHRLDGLPLALELGASRLKLLTPQELLSRLKNNFSYSGNEPNRLALLTGGAKNLPARQHTLRNTIEWSYKLLEPEEQRFLNRLAIFAGDWNVAAALAICDKEGYFETELKVLDALDSLLAKSLIVIAASDANGESRYYLLETLREFLIERLTAEGETEELYLRHATYFLEILNKTSPYLPVWNILVPPQILQIVETEKDNYRAALGWLLKTHHESLLYPVLGWLANWWLNQGYYNEGRYWLEKGLAELLGWFEEKEAADIFEFPVWQKDYSLIQVAASALNSAGLMAFYQGDYNQTVKFYQLSNILFSTIKDKKGTAMVLEGLGQMARMRGDYFQARQYYHEAIELHLELNDPISYTKTVLALGIAIWQEGQYAEARKLVEEITGKFSKTENTTLDIMYGGVLSIIMLAEDNHEESIRFVTKYLNDYGKIIGRRYFLLLSSMLAYNFIKLGKLENARNLYQQLIEEYLVSRMGEVWLLGTIVEGIAGLAIAEGQDSQAAHLFGIAEGFFNRLGVPRYSFLQVAHERDLALLNSKLDPTQLEGKWKEGEALPLAQALDFIRAFLLSYTR
jgi:non-specific serine/threonine protein kinase